MYRRRSRLIAVLFPQDTTVTYGQFPQDLFPGMSSDGTDITIPIATMAEYGLLASHCVASTGDARQLSYCLAGRIKDWYTVLADASRPQAMTASVRRSVATHSGDFPDIPKDEFKLSFYVDWPDEVVAAEPD